MITIQLLVRADGCGSVREIVILGEGHEVSRPKSRPKGKENLSILLWDLGKGICQPATARCMHTASPDLLYLKNGLDSKLHLRYVTLPPLERTKMNGMIVHMLTRVFARQYRRGRNPFSKSLTALDASGQNRPLQHEFRGKAHPAA